MNLFLSQLDGAVLIDAMLKTLLVVALAGFFAAMLRKRAASTRHAIWLAATVVLITLPMAAVVMPQLSLPLLPAEPNLVSNEVASTPLEIELSQSPAVAPLATPEAPVVAAWSWSTWALVVWGAGAFVVLARLVVGFVRLDRLCRGAHVVNDPDWQAAVEQAKQQTGVRRDVRLLKSPHAKVPMTWGLWRIDVCLPMHAIDWSATNRRIVLTHELTHVRRGDWLWQVLSIAMTAAHWFNPLAWWAAHRLRMEAENACDDAVIERGCTPSDYADCLYQMVRAAKAAPVRLSPAMTMARPSELPWRLSMILDDKTRRHETRFRTLVLTLVASAVLGSVFAAAQVGRAQNELPPSEKKQKTEPSQRPVDLSMIQRAVSRGKITAKQGKQVLEFSKLREASKIGDLSPQDHLSPDIASRLEKLGITWVEGEALLIKTRKAAYVAHRVVFAHLEGYDAATSQIALVDTTRRTSLTHTRSTKVSDENGGVV